MKKKVSGFIIGALLIGLTYAGIWSCGGGNNNPNTGAFSNAVALNILNAIAAANFATTGQANVRFTATDANGNPILAALSNPSLSSEVKVALLKMLIREALAQVGGLTCTVTSPSGSTCTIVNLTSTPGQAGVNGTVAAGVDIDNTGSMSGNDPTQLRKTAAQGFIDVLAADSADHMVSVFDFSTDTIGVSPPLAATKLDFAWALTTSANATAAKAAVVAVDGGSTNLFDSVLEICQDMTAGNHFATSITNSSSIDSRGAKAMLILTDGEDNSSTATVAQIVSCLQAGNIVAYTVGLNVFAGSQAEADLQAIANANNGIYATATDASVLTPIFQAIAGAATSGYNTATIDVDPVPASGTTVTGTITNGTASGAFSFVAP